MGSIGRVFGNIPSRSSCILSSALLPLDQRRYAGQERSGLIMVENISLGHGFFLQMSSFKARERTSDIFGIYGDKNCHYVVLRVHTAFLLYVEGFNLTYFYFIKLTGIYIAIIF